MKIFLILTLLTIIVTSITMAQREPTAEELAKLAQNPIANIISLPFLNTTNYNLGPNNDRNANLFNIEPVIPFFGGKLITRTIFNIPTIPEFTASGGSKTGFGDIIFTAYYTENFDKVMFGLGPAVTFPTGGSEFGSGKYSAGPSLAGVYISDTWVIVGLVSNIWSFAGDQDRSDVNLMSIQPVVNYNFSDFYLSFAPIITANWKAESGQQWTVPVGLGIGKIVKVGLPLNLSVGYFYNVVKPDLGPEWQLKLYAAFMIPEFLFE